MTDEVPMLSLALDVKDKPVLVVGAGPVGARRALTLWQAGAAVHVVAPQGVAEIRVGAAVGRWTWARRGWQPGDEAGCRLVCVAVPDPAVARAVHAACVAAGILVNVADRPELCDVHFPALVRRGPVQVAVSTGGLAPGLAAALRERLDAVLDASLGRFAETLSAARALLKERELPDATRLRVGAALARDSAVEQALARGEAVDVPAWVQAALVADRGAAAPEPSFAEGRVAVVGAGPGRPDWLTVRAATLLREADAVLHDALVPPAVLALARPGAELLLVGRRARAPHLDRAEVAELCVERAKRGLKVVRLKGGDPALFAGEGEELSAMRAAGVPCEVVPGITAALAAAAEAGLSLTRKGVASTVLLASGHLAPGDPRSNADWRTAGALGGTLAIYMPGKNLPSIAAALIEGGRHPATPALVVDAAGTPQARSVATTLGDVSSAFADSDAGGPSLVLVGEVLERVEAPADAQT